MSRQIHDLEDEIEFALLERRAKSIRLAAAGRFADPTRIRPAWMSGRRAIQKKLSDFFSRVHYLMNAPAG